MLPKILMTELLNSRVCLIYEHVNICLALSLYGSRKALITDCSVFINGFILWLVMISWPWLDHSVVSMCHVPTLASWGHNSDVFLFVCFLPPLHPSWKMGQFMRLNPWQSSLCSSVLTSPMFSPTSFSVFQIFIMHHSLEPISSNLFLILIFPFFLF